MKLLVLGGTSFVGRAIVEDALASGHTPTLFSRGKTGADLFPDVERRIGDRDTGDYASLADGSWDAVVDVSGYVPRHVAQAADALGDRVGRYLFISTGSVYDRTQASDGMTEDTAAARTRAGHRGDHRRDLRAAEGRLRGRRPRAVRRPRHDRAAGDRRRAARPDRPLHLLGTTGRPRRSRGAARPPGSAGAGRRLPRPRAARRRAGRAGQVRHLQRRRPRRARDARRAHPGLRQGRGQRHRGRAGADGLR